MDETRELLQTILGRLDELNARVGALEKGQTELAGRLAALEKGQTELAGRLAGVEMELLSAQRELRTEFVSFRSEVRERLDQMERRLEYFLDKLTRLDETVWHLKHS